MTLYLYLAVSLLICGLLVTPATAGPCCDGWTHFEDRCFRVVDTSATWSDGESACISHGANLVSVENEHEHQFLMSLAHKFSPHAGAVWTGGNDAVEENTWRWSDGSPFSYHKWNAGEPNNVGNEDCMEMYLRVLAFNDVKCDKMMPYICAKDA
uniref:galactose-specific lectin nattectin-like n=1 Tax=Scatophagus argus TaxID=75038 RepID=UPI001ED80F3A|nr:galactose-specific lectin nattectin-like [Scatophagus argus]